MFCLEREQFRYWFVSLLSVLTIFDKFFLKLNQIRPMKKHYFTLFFTIVCSFSTLYGQSEINLYSPVSRSVEYEGMELDAALLGKIKPSAPSVTNPNQPEAMFDVQFILRPNDSLLLGSPKRTYGVLWTGTEFWMAQWTSDTIVRFSQNGQRLGFLKIANLPPTTGNVGVRGLTMEGTNIWAVNTSDTLLRLNPTTGQIVQKLAAPTAVGGVRFATWDPTEGGGFWIGNFTSDLYKISKTGAVIRIIPRSVHGLLSMSGAAYDSVSIGGPYLWLNCQTDFTGTGANSSIVRQLKLSNGIGTSIVRDLKTDVPALSANLSGSATIATLPGLSKPSLIMVAQNTTANSGVVIGYELNFTQPNSVDIGLDSLDLANGFTMMPLRHRNTAALRVKARNIGFSTATDANVSVEMYRGFDPVTNQTSKVTIAPLSLQSFNVLNTYVPTDTGRFTTLLNIKATGDQNAVNDSTLLYFTVSDSTYATDNVETPNITSTSLSIGAGNGLPGLKRLGMTYRLPVASTIKSVTVRFRPQVSGDSIQLKIYKIQNGQVGDSVAASPIYISTRADSSSSSSVGVIRTLPLTTPLSVAANEEFLICLAEGRGGLRLFSTTKGYRPKTMWAYGSFWINTDTFSNASFRAALYLRPNITIRVGQNELVGNITEFKAFPNPMTDNLSVSVKLQEKDRTTISLFDLTGKLLFKDENIDAQYLNKTYPLSHLAVGVYILKVSTSHGNWQEKIVKQ